MWIFRNKIHYLGHVISPDGIQPGPEKVKSILQKQSQTNIKELSNWLGICGFNRAFIPNFAKLCSPFYAMTHQKAKFVWTDKEDRIINKLKEYLSTDGYAPKYDFAVKIVIKKTRNLIYLLRTLFFCIKNYLHLLIS